MTKNRSPEILSDENQNFLWEKVKLWKFTTESENLLEIGENLKQGKIHNCLRGMIAPGGVGDPLLYFHELLATCNSFIHSFILETYIA